MPPRFPPNMGPRSHVRGRDFPPVCRSSVVVKSVCAQASNPAALTGEVGMRTITNNYRDARVLNLAAQGERGPFLVTQIGIAPGDELCRERMFILRPDGKWVDFNCYVSKGQPEAMDEIVFASLSKIIEIFGTLTGKPEVLALPVDEAGLKAWVARQKAGDPVRAAEQWAAQYKMRNPQKGW